MTGSSQITEAQCYQQSSELLQDLWFLPHWQNNDFGETADEHHALITAVCEHQPEAASAAMKTHLEFLKFRIMSGQGAVSQSRNLAYIEGWLRNLRNLNGAMFRPRRSL